ncbi:thioesterase family protein [Limoniibacter endophyticus]|uniref:Thioesterase n=1 Tax=Limoniibacter endophyticus TaxID=1565040 RepID=A0A8J3DNX4_9HYPH|nr:thioesterase family protein [Limoniibacter endophyticus]GHC75324.1 thioesterase [Limoniibacter endophyticus]
MHIAAASSPFISSRMQIRPEWIDFNGHMNMAFYAMLFDHGLEQFYGRVGLGAAYAERTRHTTYTAEIHICYIRELHDGAPVTVSLQMLDWDEKRIHFFQEIRHADEGWLAATGESVTLHIDQSGPKVVPYPSDVALRIEELARPHLALPRPEQAGRIMGLRKAIR